MTNKYYRKVDFLPNIPDELILTIPEIEAQDNIFPTANIKPDGKSIFRVYDASQAIYDLLSPYMPVEHFIRWQIVTADLPIHYDWGVTAEKYLYLVNKGGKNATTRFWSEKPGDPLSGGSFEQADRELMFEVSEEERSWFMINVKTPHQVVNIEEPRLALIIRPAG